MWFRWDPDTSSRALLFDVSNLRLLSPSHLLTEPLLHLTSVLVPVFLWIFPASEYCTVSCWGPSPLSEIQRCSKHEIAEDPIESQHLLQSTTIFFPSGWPDIPPLLEWLQSYIFVCVCVCVCVCSTSQKLGHTHTRVFLYFYYFLHCSIIVKTSKLWNNRYGIL